MRTFRRRRPLRTPVERVGLLPNADMPPPPAPASDEQLLARALGERDEHAFRRVVDRYFQPMSRVARGYVRTQDEAEEVVQETWLAALTGFGRFRGHASIQTWLFHILRNRARTWGKRAARALPFSQIGVPGEQPEGDAPPFPSGLASGHGVQVSTPEHELLAGELMEQLHDALQQLPPRQREVVVLRDVEGWTSEEVRAALQLSEQNQRVLLHRGRSKLREILRPYLADGIPSECLAACVA